MDEHRQRHHRRWLASLDLEALHSLAAERGVEIDAGADREAIIERLHSAQSEAAGYPSASQAAAQLSQAADAAPPAPVAPAPSTPALQSAADVDAQVRADEELARRLMEAEEPETVAGGASRTVIDSSRREDLMAAADAEITAMTAQILADEDLARQLAAEDQEPTDHLDGGSGLPSTDPIMEALRHLAPLRQRRRERNQPSDMLDSVVAQLDALAAQTSSASLAAAPAPQPTAAAAALAALVERRPAVAVAQAAAATAMAQAEEARAHAAERSARAHAGSAEPEADPATAEAEAVGVIHQSAASSASAEGPSDRRSRPAGRSDRFAEYMAGVEARRAETQRRRLERLRHLDMALELASAGVTDGATDDAGTPVPPAGDTAFVEAHSAVSVWAGPDNTTCVICVEDLMEGDAVRTLPCGHLYHKDCIDVWLRRSRLCCVCKQPIDSHPSQPSQ